ncbi:MAG: cwlD 1 [Firmicutes bacterium]|nr:cwlD 1 [Bacillota bacterium]
MFIVRLKKKSLRLVLAVSMLVVLGVRLWAESKPTIEEVEGVDLSVLSGRTIAIDPGHGGIDSGARYNGQIEKDITLELAVSLAQVLKTYGANVVLTRDCDIDYYTRGKGGKRNDLLKRVSIINQSGADLFVSLHTNAIRGKEWFGAEVYYNPKLQQNIDIAEIVQQSLRNFPPGNKRQARKDLNILILKNIDVPGILVETGFLSNPREADLLANPTYQKNLVEHIAKALAYHFSHSVAR